MSLSRPARFTARGGDETPLLKGKGVMSIARSRSNRVVLGALRFATPAILPGLKALSGEPTPVVRALASDAAVREPAGATVLYEASDPEGDDRGPEGRYTYPTDPHYEPGILDLTGARVAADAERYYFTLRFRHLVDPGRHPELGFQLTYVAVAIDSDGQPGSGAVAVGKAADFSLPPELAYERIVYVGGAIEIDDATGKPLLTYSPATREGAIGDAGTGVVRFSVPRSFLGELTTKSRFSVLVGGQDDNGSAGLGQFRAVRRLAGQWVGGGADRDEGAPRVYDVLLPK
jgi:carbohydrate-binding DOMON domain-containing protein